MAKFIHSADYEPIISTDELNNLQIGDANALPRAEAMALAKMRNYLHRRYDTDTIFAGIEVADVGGENDSRDQQLVSYAIYFTLYILFTRIAKKHVPEDRYEQYKEAKEFFQDTMNGTIDPQLPVRQNETGEITNPSLRIFGNKETSHYY